MHDLLLRVADAQDVPLLLSLIRELAVAEEFPFPVTVTEGDLRDSLFGAAPAAEAVLCFAGDRAAGFAVFYETFATTTGKRGMHLDDLFVRPEFQGMGFGRALLTHVGRIARDRGCARFEWWCLRTNVSAIRFFQSVGARAMEELLIFRTWGKSLEQLTDREN
jgi:GNAT superfamily N-acetyltransferase